MSRSSIYETIEEEMAPTPTTQSFGASAGSPAVPVPEDTARIADSDADSLAGSSDWTAWYSQAMRKYYALRDEAHDTVEESKRTWADTALSLYAVQCENSYS
jgi:serine/arginine repetitive matrix protein 2